MSAHEEESAAGEVGLSSPWTRFDKLFPAISCLLMLGLAAWGRFFGKEEDFVVAAILFVGSLPICLVWAAVKWRHMDEVRLRGTQLIVRRRGREQRIALSDVLNVSTGLPLRFPLMATLRLREAGPFGDAVTFMPRQASLGFWGTKLKAIETLIAAVDAAKRGGRP